LKKKTYDKANWDFMKEVLVQKEFLQKWIEWVMQSVEGGKVSIIVNNEQGNYFMAYKDLRQGDLLSPLPFIFVMNALDAMLHSIKIKGRIIDLVPHLLEGGMTHL
jgi:hypothetical protein